MENVRVIVYNYNGETQASKTELQPAIVYIHGGGWIAMSYGRYGNSHHRNDYLATVTAESADCCKN